MQHEDRHTPLVELLALCKKTIRLSDNYEGQKELMVRDAK